MAHKINTPKVLNMVGTLLLALDANPLTDISKSNECIGFIARSLQSAIVELDETRAERDALAGKMERVKEITDMPQPGTPLQAAWNTIHDIREVLK